MKANEMTPEELNHLYALATIPTVALSGLIVAYYGFVHLSQLPPSTPLMYDLLTNFFPLILVALPAVFFLTFEVLYREKMKIPAKLQIKRFIGRTIIALISATTFYGVNIPLLFLLAPSISERYTLLLGFLIWLLLLGVLVTRWKTMGKITEGMW